MTNGRPSGLRCAALAVMLLAGCGSGRLAGDGDTTADASTMTPVDAGPRPCIPGIRETACAWSGAPDAAAGADATPDATIAPAMPQVFPDVNNTIGLPLHPELSRPCARASSYTLENLGDAPLTVNDLAQAGSPEFSVVDENCRGRVLDTSSRECFGGSGRDLDGSELE